MGGYFGIVGKKNDVLPDVYLGTDYHSHLGTKSAGLAAFDKEQGLRRKIHNINKAPFRTKFEDIFETMWGTSAIGSINDSDPQPLVMRSRLGMYAIILTGKIGNADELIDRYIEDCGGQFGNQTGGVNTTELAAAYINRKESFAEGIASLFDIIEGTANVVILKDDGNIIAARDKHGRLPVHVGKSEEGYALSFESYAYQKLGYEDVYELGPAEIVEISPDGITVLKEAEPENLCVCSFLWSYYGYPTSTYEGKNVEVMRYKNGAIMAKNDKENGVSPKVDFVAGIPDSGTPHAMGYAAASQETFARPFIKYTPTWSRSFMPSTQKERQNVAKLKMIPVKELIEDKDLLFVDDSIVRGTQIKGTVDFLYHNGAKTVHFRSACPPIMYGCKYLNFTRQTEDMELVTRATIVELEGEEGLKHVAEYADPTTDRAKRMREAIRKKLHLGSLEFQTLDGLIEAIGIDKCKLCTYCWNGKEK